MKLHNSHCADLIIPNLISEIILKNNFISITLYNLKNWHIFTIVNKYISQKWFLCQTGLGWLNTINPFTLEIGTLLPVCQWLESSGAVEQQEEWSLAFTSSSLGNFAALTLVQTCEELPLKQTIQHSFPASSSFLTFKEP